MSIDIIGVSKKFDSYEALNNINLSIQPGELTALLGPSGSGKTTLLRIIAGLESADSGRILFDGIDITENSVRSRGIGFVFQHYALFKHMNVFENVAFGLRVKPKKERLSEGEIRHKVEELLNLVQLKFHAKSYPHELSGGQKQRIALARALAVEPKVLLLDEPFGALDAKVRKELRAWLRRLHDETGVTSLFVTHDQEEALEVADKIVVMNRAKIEQEGTPEEVYSHPASPFVYSFLGEVNLFHGRHPSQEEGVKTITYVRPHDVEIYTEYRENTVAATIIGLRVIGGTVRVELQEIDGHGVEAHIPSSLKNQLGLSVGLKCYLAYRNQKHFEKNELYNDYSI